MRAIAVALVSKYRHEYFHDAAPSPCAAELMKIERKGHRLFGVSADADDPLGVWLFEEIESGLHAKYAIPAEDHIGLHMFSLPI